MAYIIAHKSVLYNNSWRTLIVIAVRGTVGKEWLGNMDITGTSYDANMIDHYSFRQATNNLKTNGLSQYELIYDIDNPIYLITGHSRGAAVANLLADDLTQTDGIQDVFAYTFATPNTTRQPVARSNIFNFCFEDDFVPQSPLTGWGYGKHGISYTAIAEDLYNGNASFKTNLYTSLCREAEFNKAGTIEVIDYVYSIANSIESYYHNLYAINDINTTDSAIISASLYTYLRDYVAAAAAGDLIASGSLASTVLTSTTYKTISSYFVGGSGVLFFENYISDTHDIKTYIIALRFNLFEQR